MSVDKWIETFQAHGYRLTGSRRELLVMMAASQHAMTPMELFERARAHYPSLGLVTVYRTLEKLEELHLIQRVHTPQGCQAFISAAEGHQHILLCSHCGRYTYFSGDDLEGLMQAIDHRTGYRVTSHWLQVFGTCRECQEQDHDDPSRN